ncbi:DinB family protein [Ammoniphilus resinae]|uniref:Damage-inducible protein DinB n=1 Tax=Ammoniphilus resinae TaxID=861532 RepID=A0ABS4GKW6_9BACL|nr:putative damage-inducible protein DinB [Ammoniphilus resinae]
MNYRTIEDFQKDWNLEGGLTLKVLGALTDESLKQTVSEAQQRTLGDLAWHLVGAIPVLLGAGGLQIDAPNYETPTPTNAAEIADSYRRMSEVAMTALKEQWTDGKLAESLSLFGFIDTTYSGLLSMVVKHQIHHRGQMTILMRQAGVVPPGVYGPNEEESAALRAARDQK